VIKIATANPSRRRCAAEGVAGVASIRELPAADPTAAKWRLLPRIRNLPAVIALMLDD
jgi:hypothetical protein